MPELLLELLSEEIPARMQARAAADLKRIAAEELKAARLEFDDVRTFVTPRRLVLVVDGLPERQPDIKEERRGPRVGAPEKAVIGFGTSIGLSTEQVDKLNEIEIDGARLPFKVTREWAVEDEIEVSAKSTATGEFFFVHREIGGRNIAEILPNLLHQAIRSLVWPKSMRWGTSDFHWVRPIRNVVAIFDGKVLQGKIEIGTLIFEEELPELLDWQVPNPLPFTGTTTGHRFLAPDPIPVENFSDYEEKLRKAYVILDSAERREIIAREVERLSVEEGFNVRDDQELLEEVIGLVEWPVVRIGRIDEGFMGLWSDVLVTAMRRHQKYFSLLEKDGSLAPRFIVVADTEPKDEGKAIVAGNERVLRARLADARFFKDQDMSQPLENYVPRLDQLVFHARLGSMLDKVLRVERLAGSICVDLLDANPKFVVRAAHLCKADLVTQMVGEFPELQGIMGGRYAFYGPPFEDAEIATAIREHYSPLGPSDQCPTAPTSVAVALADKIDTLVGFFAIGEKPTGSKDPYALRRSALGVIRLIIENNLQLSLHAICEAAYEPYGDQLLHDHEYAQYLSKKHLSEEQLADENIEQIWEDKLARLALHFEAVDIAITLLVFCADRLKVHLREQGVRHDLIEALFSRGNEDDLLRLVRKADALKVFLETDDGSNLLTAYRRANNIVRIEEKRDGENYLGGVIEDLFSQDEEKILWDKLSEIESLSRPKSEMAEFTEVLQALATLRGPVDRFFDEVTVNCDDESLRENRLRMLSEISACLDAVADFSKIEG